MDPALHKVLNGPHSPPVLQMLEQDGWSINYRPDWSRIRGWSELYGASADQFAEEFMSNYAFITASFPMPEDTDGARWVKMNPILVIDEVGRADLDRFTEAAGERVFPVGEVDGAVLLLGNRGSFFMTVPLCNDLYCLGEGWDGLHDYLKTGKRSTILARQNC